MVCWKPLAKARVSIITVTLITVAPIDSRITKRENDFCWLKAMRRAIKAAIFNRYGFLFAKSNRYG